MTHVIDNPRPPADPVCNRGPGRTVVLVHCLLGLCVLISPGLSGCSRDDDPAAPPSGQTRPFAGTSLRVAVPGGLDLANVWDLPLSEWRSRTGADCELVKYPVTSREATADAGGSGDVADLAAVEADVYLVPLSRVSEIIGDVLPVAMPPSVQTVDHLDLQSFAPAFRERVIEVARQPRVMPVSCPVLLCYYRADLLEQAGLQPPTTWDEYGHLLDTLNEWAPGKVAVEPWAEEWRATMFLTRAVALAKHPDQYSFTFDVATGEPLIDGAGFVAALEQSAAAVQQMPADVLTYTPADCRRELLAGRAALGIALETDPAGRPLPLFTARASTAPTEAAPATGAESGKDNDEQNFAATTRTADVPRADDVKLGIVPVPGSRRAFNTSTGEWANDVAEERRRAVLVGFGGLAFVVSGDCASPEAAWNLIESLTMEEFATNFPAPVGGVIRQHSDVNPLPAAGDSLSAAEREQWQSAVQSSLASSRLTLELPVPNRDGYRRLLTQGVTRVLVDNVPADTALTDVAAAWKAEADRDPAAAENLRRNHARRLNVTRD